MPDFEDLVGKPKRVKTDAADVEAKPAKDDIALDQYAEAKKVTGSGWAACRPARSIPPGANGPGREEA